MNDAPQRLPLNCPQCGFRIFNRRYPKCERCGVDLPESAVHSAAETQAMQAQERTLEEQQRQTEAEDRLEEWKVRARSTDANGLI